MHKHLLTLLLLLLTWGSSAAQTLPTTPRKDYILYPRLQVLEEGTGTWCGFCPRGMETIDRLRKEGKVNFVAIAVHQPQNNWSIEPMEVYDYRFLSFKGYPGGIVNRKARVSMFYGETHSIIGRQSKETPYKVELDIVKTSALDFDLNITTTLGFNHNDAHLRLQYVLVEDSVGPYRQSNYFAYAGRNDGSAPSWTKRPGQVEMHFMDVARMVYPVGTAAETEGQLPKVMRRGEAVKQTFHLFLPGGVAKARNCRVVALLLDTETGEILNAAVQELRTVTGLHLPLAPNADPSAEQGRAGQGGLHDAPHFDLSGRRISPTSRGLHVVKGQKVMVP